MRGDFIVVDIETTGFIPTQNKITEIAAVHLQNNTIINEFSTLVNPGCKIPENITTITGIDDDLVKDAPSIQRALPQFLDFLNTHTFVAHNASFDYGFLNYNARVHLRKPIMNPQLCTVRLARKKVKGLANHKLGTLCNHFNIPNNQAHRALSDARATAALLMRLLH